jgi:hypothetical protein
MNLTTYLIEDDPWLETLNLLATLFTRSQLVLVEGGDVGWFAR